MGTVDAILATLATEESTESSRNGVVHGRTLLQKKLYFLSVLSGEPLGFRAHYYGPYSAQVSTSLGALIEAGFVDESRVDLDYGAQTAPEEMSRFDYRLSCSGKDVLRSRPEICDPYREHLKRINSSWVASDIRTISIAAKVHFIVSYQGESTVEEIREQAQTLGWNLSDSEVGGVVDYLEQLELVKAR